MTGLSLFFGINGAIFLAVGLRALLKPLETVAEPFALTVNDVDGMSYLRSGTGGVSVTSGLLLLAAIWVPQLQLPAVILFVTMLGGLLAGRVYSGVVDGSPGLVPLFSGFCEFLGLIFGVGWLTVLWTQGG